MHRPSVPRWLWAPALAFVLTRGGIVLVAYVAQVLITDSTVPPPYHLRPDNLLLDVFASRWDSGFFLRIAREGYWWAVGKELPGFSAFPLLPLLISALTSLGLDPLVAGVLVTNSSLLGASVLLHRLTGEELGDETADRAVFYFLSFPTSFFGSAVYSESLFLVSAVGTAYLARRGKWAGAGAAGALASASRLVGLFTVFLIAGEWLRQRTERSGPARPGPGALAAVAAVPLGTLAYAAYLWQGFGNPLEFVAIQARWGRPPALPLSPLVTMFASPPGGWPHALVTGRFWVDPLVDGLAGVLFLVLGGILLKQRRWGEGAFVLAGTILPLCTALAMSQRRFVWVLFPVFPLLARWGRAPWVDRGILTTSLLLLALSTALFANWYWAG